MVALVEAVVGSARMGAAFLMAYGLRTATALLGLAIAVSSVMLTISIGEGARQRIQDLIAAEGMNIVYVTPKLRNVAGVRTGKDTRTTLTVGDALELKTAIPDIEETCWWRQDPSQVISGSENTQARVVSIFPGCQLVKDWFPERGREITQAQFDQAESVALLGAAISRQLFPDTDPLGAAIRIRNVPFRVIGVIGEKGPNPGGYDQDDIVLIPYSTATRKLLGAERSYVEVIAARTYERDLLPSVAEEARQLLRTRHRIRGDSPNDFTVRTQLDVERFYQGASGALTNFLVVIALLSFLVGGIGAMNVLLVSVTERTREIGVRMAVGAKRRHILMQFLIEALALCLLGGALGVGLGFVGSEVATMVAGWPTVTEPYAVLWAMVSSILVGLAVGLYPALKAARLNPIEALRYE